MTSKEQNTKCKCTICNCSIMVGLNWHSDVCGACEVGAHHG
jgi:hypothetical protein